MCVRTTHQPTNHTPKPQPQTQNPKTYKDILLIKFLMMLKRVRIWLLRQCLTYILILIMHACHLVASHDMIFILTRVFLDCTKNNEALFIFLQMVLQIS